MIRYPLAIILLSAVYALVIASTALWDLLIGALLAAGLLFLCRRLLDLDAADHRASATTLLRIPAFIGATLGEMVAGSWRVALVMLGVRPRPEPEIIEVPLDERTRLEIAVSGFAHTLSPDSFLIEIDEERGVVLYQVLDASDPEALREQYRRFYLRFQKPVFRHTEDVKQEKKHARTDS